MQVDVEQPRTHRIQLVVLEDRVVGGLLPLEDDVEDGVQAVIPREDAAEITLLDRERMRLLPGAVENARDHSARTQPPRDGAARLLARFDVELDALTGHSGGQV